MLKMVILNPRQLTMVRAVPRLVSGAYWATRVENMGESAVTAIPQISIKASKVEKEDCHKTKGESKQQMPESAKAIVAICLGG